MPKKKSSRPHGHYCKICGEYKANEKFSGSPHLQSLLPALRRRKGGGHDHQLADEFSNGPVE